MIDHLLTIVPPWLIILLVVFGVVLGTVAYLIFMERKVASWVQDRIGPNRVGPWGLLQSVADGIKMLVKEDYRPAGTDKVLFTLAPCLMMTVIIGAMAVIPWGGILQGTRSFNVAGGQAAQMARQVIPAGAYVVGQPVITGDVAQVTYRYSFQIADVNLGVLYLVAMLSLGVYGIVIGGWSSNNKFSFLGGMRAAAQMISYEVPFGLSLLTIIVMFGTFSLGDIIAAQSHNWMGFLPAWNVFTQPLAFILFLTCIHAEANRSPFDLAECEQELIGGYHTEYSSMRFGLFFLGEYTGMVVTSAVCVALFFGGWHLPGLTDGTDPANPAVTTSLTLAVLRALVYFAKIIVIIFVFMWVRWSLPRFRFDQLMGLAWKGMIPVSLLILMGTTLVIYFLRIGQPARDVTRPADMVISGKEAGVLLAMNVVLLAVVLVGRRLLPAGPAVNRRLTIPGSRFSATTSG
jgi:NADH-quinone oxidoreductase subunit H